MGACCSKNMQVEDGSDNKSQYRRAHSYSHPKTERNSLLAQSSAAEIFERAEADSILPSTHAVKAALMKEPADITSPHTGTTCECEDNLSQTNIATECSDEISAYAHTHTQFQESAATGTASPTSRVPVCVSEDSKIEVTKVEDDTNDDNAITTYVYGLLTNRRTNQSTPAKIPVRMPMTSRSHTQHTPNIQSYIHTSGEESNKSNISRTTLLPISEADVVTEDNTYINLGNISPNASPSHYMPQHMFLTARSHVGNNTRREYNFANTHAHTHTHTGPQHFRIGTVDSGSQSDASEWHRITSQDSSEWDFEFWENFDASAFEVSENTTNKAKPHAFIPVLNMELVAALRASENGFSPIAANVNSFKAIPGLISTRTTYRDGHASVHTPAQPMHSHTHTYMPASVLTQNSVMLDSDVYTQSHTPQHKSTQKQVMFAHSNTMPNLSAPAHTYTQTQRHVTGVLKSSQNTHTQHNTQGSQTQRVNVSHNAHTEAQAVVEKIRKLATSRQHAHTHTHNAGIHTQNTHTQPQTQPQTHRPTLIPISQAELFGDTQGLVRTHTHTHKGVASARDLRTHDTHTYTYTEREPRMYTHTLADTHTLTVSDKDVCGRDSSPQPPVAEERVRPTHTHVDTHTHTHTHEEGEEDTDSHTYSHKAYTHRHDLVTGKPKDTSLASRALSTHRRGEDPHYTHMYTRDDTHTQTHTHTQADGQNGDSMSSEGSLAWTSLHTASMGRMGSQDTGMSFCSTQSSCVPAEEDQKHREVQKQAHTNPHTHTNTHTHTNAHTLNGLVTTRRQPNILMDTVEEEEINNNNNVINAAITTR